MCCDGLAKELGEHDAEGVDQSRRLLEMSPSCDLERRMEYARSVEIVEHRLKTHVHGRAIDGADVVDQRTTGGASARARHLEHLEEVVVKRRWYEHLAVY